MDEPSALTATTPAPTAAPAGSVIADHCAPPSVE
jgi:hypothetical protein